MATLPGVPFPYDLDEFGRRFPPKHPTATRHEGIAFNALPPGARQAFVGLLDGPPPLIPVKRSPHPQARAGRRLLLLAGAAVFAGLFVVLFQIVTQRVPRVLPWLPLHALVVGVPLYVVLALFRARKHAPVFPYENGVAYLITARDLVWLDGDRLTVIPFDPGALYVRDVPGSKRTYVVMQLGPAQHPSDPAIAGGGSRDEAVQQLVAIQEDLRGKRAAVDAALARGDLATAGALDPLHEVRDRLAPLAQASRDYGPPAAQGPAAVIYQAPPPAWLAKAGAVVGVGALLGGCCLSSASMAVCDQLLYLSASSSEEHQLYRKYDFDGRLRPEANRASWTATCRRILDERLKAAKTPAEQREVREQFLADFPGSPLQGEVEESLRKASR